MPQQELSVCTRAGIMIRWPYPRRLMRNYNTWERFSFALYSDITFDSAEV